MSPARHKHPPLLRLLIQITQSSPRPSHRNQRPNPLPALRSECVASYLASQLQACEAAQPFCAPLPSRRRAKAERLFTIHELVWKGLSSRGWVSAPPATLPARQSKLDSYVDHNRHTSPCIKLQLFNCRSLSNAIGPQSKRLLNVCAPAEQPLVLPQLSQLRQPLLYTGRRL